MRIVIVGLGSTGRELARTLIDKDDNEVVLIDIDEEVTEELSEQFDAVTITGDGSNPDILKQARLDEADALVALTDSDAINLVIAVLARRWKIGKVAVKLSRIGLEPAAREIVSDIRVVMPHASAANAIVQSIYGREKSSIAEAIGGALYQDTVEVDGGAGKRIRDLDLPGNSLVIAVRREGDILLAGAELGLRDGDQLIVLSEDEQTVDAIRSKLAGG